MRDRGVTGGSISYLQSHPSSDARWLPTGALMVADHGGSNDDRITAADSYATGKTGKTTVVVVFDWKDSGHDSFRFFTNAGYALTHDRIGYDGGNGFAHHDVISLPRSVRNNKTMTAVISIDATAAKQLSTSLRIGGQIVVPSSRSGLASYLGDGTLAPTLTPYLGTSEFPNFYHPAGVLRLWAVLPDVFLNKGAADALSDNPWQIIRPRRRITYFDLGAGAGSSLNAAASGQARASGGAQLAAQIALAGIGVAVAGGYAAAAVAVPLAAAGIAVAGGQANARATIAISAAGLAQAAGQAGLSATVLAQAAGAAQAAGNAQLAAQLQALASGAAQASGAANLSGGAPGVLSAAGTAEASGAAVLTVTVNLAAAGSAQAGGAAAGQLLAAGSLAAFGQAVAGGAAWPTLQVNLAASGGAQSGGQASATLSAADQITAIGSAQASGQATLSITATLTAAGFALAMGAGGLSIEIPLAAFGTAQAGGSAGLVDVPDYIPVAPLRLAAGCQRPATLRAPAMRTIHLRHEATRAH